MSKRIVLVVFMAGVLGACADQGKSTPQAPSGGDPIAVDPPTGRVASMDAVANVPTFLWADRKPGTAASLANRPTDAVAAARAHIAGFASFYRLSTDQVNDLELRDLHDTGRGAIIARFGRRIDGIEVLGEQISVAMDRHLDVVALTGFVTGDLPGVAKIAGKRARDSFSLGTTRAMTAAMSDLSGARMEAQDFEAPVAAAGDYQTFRMHPSGALRAQANASADPARVKQVFYRSGPDSLTAAYYTEVDLGNDADKRPRNFSYIIAGDSEKVLFKKDLTAYDHPVSYRVYADSSGLFQPFDGPQGTAVTPSPTGVPDGFQPVLVPSQLVTLSSLTAVGVNDPWLPPGATETLGNNVDAYLDIAPPDGFTPGSADFRGTVSSPDTFDYVFDTGVSANANPTQRLAAVTQLFFNDNWFHDFYYAAGFTETAGNAQFSNYGRGGIEGDGLRAEAQDFTSFNNANMSTPADGGRPRMQMYLWTKPTELRITVDTPPDLAGDFTNLGTAVFGPLNFSLSGPIVRANPVDACTPLVGDYSGKIVFADRGGVAACNGFAGKTQRAQDAGAIAIIIANVPTSANPGTPPGMGGTPTEPITIGVVSLNLSDGDRFRAVFTAGEAVSGEVVRTVQLLDGDIDNQIVAHEWGHYISNRLIFNANGLNNNMARGLGEGWADFHAMLITARAEDTENPLNANWQGTFCMGCFATSADPLSYYYGIRRYPYSTDMTKNPLTFRHISDVNPLPTNPAPHFDATHSEVHNAGEIWTTMLWESYAAILRDTVGGSPRLTFAEAQLRMRDYIVAAYKLTPADPTLLEARDAVILAAMMNDPIDGQEIGQAFAKRGAGVNAVAPPRGENTNTPVVESYAYGPSLQQSSAFVSDDVSVTCGADNILDDGEVGTFHVTFKNVGTTDTPTLDAEVSSATTGIGFPDGTTLHIPPLARTATAEVTIHVAASGIALNAPYSITVTTPDAGSGENHPVTYTFSGNADEAGGVSNIDTVERSFSVWLQTASQAGIPADSVWRTESTSPSNHAYACRSAPFAASVELVSPAFSVPPGGSLALAFKHRHSFERDAINNLNFDGGVIEYTIDNGATWTDVSALGGTGIVFTGLIATGGGNPIEGRPAFTGTSAGYPAFQNAALNLGASFGGQVVRLRFRVGSDAGVSSPGWEIDDIQITGSAVPLFPGLVDNSPTCNNQPIANAGANQTVAELGPAPTFTPTTVFLDGSASIDPNGNPLIYKWTQIAGPPVTLSSAGARIPTFTAPAVPRTPGSVQLIFQLVVNDGTLDSAAKLTTVSVRNTNRPPVANAGLNQTVPEGSTVTLDGTASSDPDPGDPALTYLWTAPAGITLSDPTAAKPTFVAPQVTGATPFVFSLVVSDGAATSAPAQVTITVTDVNHAPVANAGPDVTVRSVSRVTLHGTGTDPDGDAIQSFSWTAPAGIHLFGEHTARPFFIAPFVLSTTTFTLSLVVTDSHGLASAPDTVVVTVKPL